MCGSRDGHGHAYGAPGEAWARRKFGYETLQRSPAGRPRPATPSQHPEASLARAQGRPWPRSVDSERAGRVIEPRKCLNVGAAAFVHPAAAPRCRPGEARRPGRGLRARQASDGLPRNLGGLRACRQLLAKREGRPKRGAKGMQESERPSRSEEVGERVPSGPCGAKAGAGSRNCWRER